MKNPFEGLKQTVKTAQHEIKGGHAMTPEQKESSRIRRDIKEELERLGEEGHLEVKIKPAGSVFGLKEGQIDIVMEGTLGGEDVTVRLTEKKGVAQLSFEIKSVSTGRGEEFFTKYGPLLNLYYQEAVALHGAVEE